jgi:hypothetical protein
VGRAAIDAEDVTGHEKQGIMAPLGSRDSGVGTRDSGARR